jgi:two-component system, NarL family, sensor kinase
MDTTEKEIYSAFLIVLGIIGLVLLYFIISIIRQHRRYRGLAKAKIFAEITTLERERKRIAGDLHDEIGPLLSAVKLQINHLEAEDDQQKGMIEKSSLYIDDVIRRMREISNDLLPSILVRRGLKVAVEDFLEKLKPGTETIIETDINLTERLPIDIEINLYRMIHEIAHNALKHAKATRFRLEMGINEGKIRLATADNGVGFSENVHSSKEAGLGLLNLQSRTEVMGGEIFCESAPGKGTKYILEIPLTEKMKV